MGRRPRLRARRRPRGHERPPRSTWRCSSSTATLADRACCSSHPARPSRSLGSGKLRPRASGSRLGAGGGRDGGAGAPTVLPRRGGGAQLPAPRLRQRRRAAESDPADTQPCSAASKPASAVAPSIADETARLFAPGRLALIGGRAHLMRAPRCARPGRPRQHSRASRQGSWAAAAALKAAPRQLSQMGDSTWMSQPTCCRRGPALPPIRRSGSATGKLAAQAWRRRQQQPAVRQQLQPRYARLSGRSAQSWPRGRRWPGRTRRACRCCSLAGWGKDGWVGVGGWVCVGGALAGRWAPPAQRIAG
jgi:hypothetical protein